MDGAETEDLLVERVDAGVEVGREVCKCPGIHVGESDFVLEGIGAELGEVGRVPREDGSGEGPDAVSGWVGAYGDFERAWWQWSGAGGCGRVVCARRHVVCRVLYGGLEVSVSRRLRRCHSRRRLVGRSR